MFTHDVTVPGASPRRAEPVDEPPHVVDGDLVDAARAEPVEDVVAEPLPVEVDRPLRVAAALVADPDARLKMLEPLGGQLVERRRCERCRRSPRSRSTRSASSSRIASRLRRRLEGDAAGPRAALSESANLLLALPLPTSSLVIPSKTLFLWRIPNHLAGNDHLPSPPVRLAYAHQQSGSQHHS